MEYSPIVLEWKYGGRRDLWVKNAAFIRELIAKSGAKPISPETAHAPGFAVGMALEAGPATKGVATEGPRALLAHRIPFPGGLRVPHFHLEGSVYPVDEQQWRAFTTTIVGELKGKLEAAQGISFDQAMALSDAATSFA